MIKINLSLLFEDISQRLSYISGKRAADTNDFFRHSLTDKDFPLIKNLADESLCFLGAKAIDSGFSYTMTEEVIKIKFKKGFNPPPERLLYHLLLHCIIHRWLLITGLYHSTREDYKTEYFDNLFSHCFYQERSLGPLRPRFTPPL